MFSRTNIFVKRFCIDFEYVSHAKFYGRWTHRTPAKVLLPEDQVNNSQDDSDRNEQYDSRTKSIYASSQDTNAQKSVQNHHKIKKLSMAKNIKRKMEYDMLQTVVDSKGEFVYTKLSNKDSRVTALLTSLQSNNPKDKTRILLEGKRLIKEALQNSCILEYLLFSRKDDVEQLKPFLPNSGAILYKLPYREIQLWSDLTTAPGIIGIFKKPTLDHFTPENDTLPITIICDNIREPGNLGSVLRTCAGVGCQNVILTKGCVNLWNSKVTRSGSGAHFHLQIHSKVDWSQMDDYISLSSKILMADSNLFHSSTEYLEDSLLQIQSVPIIPYYSIQIDKTDSIILIIGGETEGLSEDAYKFVYNMKGVRLNIPLTSGIDSLNTGVALGILLFELKKQILLNNCTTESEIHNVG